MIVNNKILLPLFYIIIVIFVPLLSTMTVHAYPNLIFDNGNQKTNFCPRDDPPNRRAPSYPDNYSAKRDSFFQNINATHNRSYIVFAMQDGHCHFEMFTHNSPNDDDKLRIIEVNGDVRVYPPAGGGITGYRLLRTNIVAPDYSQDPENFRFEGYIGLASQQNNYATESQGYYRSITTAVNSPINTGYLGVIENNNLEYDDSYQGLLLNSDYDPMEEKGQETSWQNQLTAGMRSCGYTDLFCHISNILTGFVNLFKFIFVPNSDNITSKMTELFDTIYIKLGFLTFPFSFINQMRITITEFQYTNTTGVGCGIFDGLFGASIPDRCLLYPMHHQGGFQTALVWLQTFAKMALTLVLLGLLHRKYLEVVKS